MNHSLGNARTVGRGLTSCSADVVLVSGHRCHAQVGSRHFAFGSFASIARCPREVRFTPKNRHLTAATLSSNRSTDEARIQDSGRYNQVASALETLIASIALLKTVATE
jgi:hypothetical protein